MTSLTKIFIVFHVILSLLLAAGLIVFVNRTENFKSTIDTQTSTITRLTAAASTANADAQRQASDAIAARAARDAAVTKGQADVAAIQLEIGKLQGQLAAATASLNIAQIAMDNNSAALKASEDARKQQSDIMDSTRADNNVLAGKNVQLNLAVADLTNKLEVAVRQVTNLNEAVAEYKSLKEKYEKQLTDAGIPLTGPSGVAGGAPPINGVVRHTQLIGGIPYATISVGSQDQVKPGMKFNVVDREHAKFLGELTVEQVDEKEATGRLEGPGISEVHANTEVKTQL